jgi:Tol biopolymer transport system component
MRVTIAIALIAALAAATPAAQAAFPGANGRIAFERDLDECFNERFNIESVNPVDSMPFDFGTIEERRQPAWHPDGTRLAYVENFYIAHSTFDATEYQSFSPTLFDEDPTWSPDGAHLAWVGFPDSTGIGHIWKAEPDGANAVQLTSGPADDVQPAWSPDGSRIAFASARDGDMEIYVMNPDGSAITQLTSNSVADETPNWSPDGGRIAFARNLDIWTMRADGIDLQQVTSGPDQDRAPAWSPDGAQIAFDRGHNIWTMGASGTGQTNLTPWPPVTCDTNPDWQPLPVNAYPRPRGASPMYLSLVPAYEACTAPNSTHGAPLAFGSCTPPVQSSSALVVDTRSINSAVINARVGNPGTAADEADVRMNVIARDVRMRSDLSDYAGVLEGRLSLRITDRDNSPHPGGPGPGTVTDLAFPFDVPCTVTTETDRGSTCSVLTSADAVLPDTVEEERRSIWELGRLELRDANGARFLVQGLFVP